jgi:hypothetical protein
MNTKRGFISILKILILSAITFYLWFFVEVKWYHYAMLFICIDKYVDFRIDYYELDIKVQKIIEKYLGK